MAKIYLGLGTNLGDKEQNLRFAMSKIEKRIGEIVSLSAFYMTEPWGFDSGNFFLNAVTCIETSLMPMDVLIQTQSIEQEMGRTKKSVARVYSDRLIDIDLLLYDNCIIHSEELTLPHPLMMERLFVLQPLCEIAPELYNPETGVRFIDALQELEKK